VVFLLFLISFAVLEIILWRADVSKKAPEVPLPDALPSVIALAQSLSAEGRGATPEAPSNKPVDTLK
jgi:hypothetical protein